MKKLRSIIGIALALLMAFSVLSVSTFALSDDDGMNMFEHSDFIEKEQPKLDEETKKISLGFKNIEDNPWEILKRDYPVGTVVDAKIVSFATFGAFANILPTVDGLIHISQISWDRIKTPQDVLKVGDEVTAKVVDFNSEDKKISLSIKALLAPEPEAEPEKEETKDTLFQKINSMSASINDYLSKKVVVIQNDLKAHLDKYDKISEGKIQSNLVESENRIMERYDQEIIQIKEAIEKLILDQQNGENLNKMNNSINPNKSSKLIYWVILLHQTNDYTYTM